MIYRFNGLWPKSEDLHQWISINWTKNYDICPCADGFFVFQFDHLKYMDYVINEGPWFWGMEGLFITPWFPAFDAAIMVITKIPIWVIFHNLQLPFWNHQVLKGIENSFGRIIKMDWEIMDKCIFTFSCICMEIYLIKGIPNCIHLNHQDFKQTQCPDFEKIAFRCRICH